MMKKLISILVMVLLSSCSSMRYGNFTQISQDKDEVLAKDAVNRLAKVYVPARTTFTLSHKAHDGFGEKIIENLRKNGYGVVETASHQKPANFYYVVDESNKNEVYRVSLFVGDQVYSRAYLVKEDVLAPISAWSHKESA